MLKKRPSTATWLDRGTADCLLVVDLKSVLLLYQLYRLFLLLLLSNLEGVDAEVFRLNVFEGLILFQYVADVVLGEVYNVLLHPLEYFVNLNRAAAAATLLIV